MIVDAEVENRGGAVSPGFQASLHRIKDGVRVATALRNIPGNDHIDVNPIRPGEKRAIQLRWDPENNAGDYNIALAIDSNDVVAEPDKKNNEAAIPLHVRTKSRLAIGNLSFRQSENPGELILLAEVGNLGETDASRVLVNFYKQQKQTEENLIGEVVIDRISAGRKTLAEYTWQVDVSREEFKTLEPSFAVSLKGSLMRASSVADESESGSSPPDS